jgi:hypothetical protein
MKKKLESLLLSKAGLITIGITFAGLTVFGFCWIAFVLETIVEFIG